MSVFYNNALIGASGQAAGGYQISRSVRLNSADSAYLSRAPASTGNRKTWTLSCWVKRSGLSVYQNFFGGRSGSTGFTLFSFTADNKLQYVDGTNTSSGSNSLEWSYQFRDPSAWYHIQITQDTTQATAQDRLKLYVNGSRVNEYTIGIGTGFPAQNFDGYVNASGFLQAFSYNSGSQFGNFYLADVHLVDGQALTPTSFGEFDSNNVWQPKAYTGTYGTNGFHLDFADNSAATATTLGKDTSGNGNNWTPTNLSVTAGAGNDSLRDSPTNGSQADTGVGGEVSGNYATLNPLAKGSNVTLTNGNLDYACTLTSNTVAVSTIAMSSGKWYCEFTATSSNNIFGLYKASLTSDITYVGVNANGWGYYSLNGNKYNNGSGTTYGSTFTTNDVIGVAFDADAGSLYFYKNGVAQNSGTAAFTGLTSGPYVFATGTNNGSISAVFNAGQRPFAYAAPSGFKALCTANMPEPTIKDGSTAMDVKTWTGNGGTQTITLGFSPDLVWVKNRSGTTWNTLVDSVRGTPKELYSNATNAEVASPTASNITNFTSTGFDVAPGSIDASAVNASGSSYVAWTWDAGSSTVTNTDGSVTSTVRANASAGFSVVTWTGTGADATIGHGLGVTPGLIIVKNRTQVRSWRVWHSTFGVNDYITLDTTAAKATLSTTFQSQSSTTFGVGSNDSVNSGSSNIVAYCFAPVAGYSSFGSYTGNGSTDGPFVFCNFRPTFVMLKYSSGAGGNWVIYDNKRGAINLNSKKLAPNLAGLENDGSTLGDDSVGIDFLSNGFKIRTTGLNHNVSAGTYIYAAFAESPFALARAR